MKMKKLHMIAFLLLLIGGLNWLLVGIFAWDLGELFGGRMAAISRIIYVLVGLSAIAEILGHKKCCSACGAGCKDCGKEKSGAPESAGKMSNSGNTH